LKTRFASIGGRLAEDRAHSTQDVSDARPSQGWRVRLHRMLL